jgi:DNA repair exonuclease SbcCD ATPase subunit
MNEEMKPAVIVSEEYTKAFLLDRSIKANAQAMQQSLYEVCTGLKEMRDGKLYKELGYQNFEDYTENEVGIKKVQAYKYVAIATNLTSDFVHSSEQIGTTKLALLAKLDEPTRQEVTETVDVENTTVKELKAQISALTAERDEAKATIETKDKQFRQAMDSKNNELTEVKAGWKRRSDTLLEKIAALQKELEEAKAEPQEVAVEDTSRVEELQKQLEQAPAELAEAHAQLAERPMVQEALPVADTTDAFKAYMSAAADSMRRLLEFVGRRPNDPNREMYLSRIDGVLNLSNTELSKMKGAASCQ